MVIMREKQSNRIKDRSECLKLINEQGKWTKYNHLIARNVSDNAAIIFGLLENFEDYFCKNFKDKYLLQKGYFNAEQEFVKLKTKMGKQSQKIAIDALEEIDFIKTTRREGNKKYFQINWLVVAKKLVEWEEIYKKDEIYFKSRHF